MICSFSISTYYIIYLGVQKSPLQQAEDENNPWYHLNLPQNAAFPVPTDRKRNIGRTRLRLLKISAEPLGKEFGAFLLLPCTKRQLSAKRRVALTGFRHSVLSCITIPPLAQKVNTNVFHKMTNVHHF